VTVPVAVVIVVLSPVRVRRRAIRQCQGPIAKTPLSHRTAAVHVQGVKLSGNRSVYRACEIATAPVGQQILPHKGVVALDHVDANDGVLLPDRYSGFHASPDWCMSILRPSEKRRKWAVTLRGIIIDELPQAGLHG